ncbi:hypothetical protein L596_025569 [Steinernema carpocapsae]|uniref:Uncharacterized protein n=1 Tax=Steinernema carpocapsae TaxID=34508 RepID=A0A4V5ZYV9_STECR|nr:hypothetical protein L596_025569 [Steinernema carpocapsae]
MEFTPFQFIEQVLFQCFHDASIFSDLSSFWGERATLFARSYFDLELYLCQSHSCLRGWFAGKPPVSIDDYTQTFNRDPSTYLRNLVIYGDCKCEAKLFSTFDMQPMFAALSDYMQSTTVLPKKVNVNLDDEPSDETSERDRTLYHFLTNDLWAQKSCIKLRSINPKNVQFVKRILKSNTVGSMEYEELGALDDRDFSQDEIAPHMQTDVLRMVKFPTSCAELHVQGIIKMWMENPRREDCKLYVNDAVTRLNLFNSLELLTADIAKQNPTAVVSKPLQAKENRYVFNVAERKKQITVSWEMEINNSAQSFIRLQKSN